MNEEGEELCVECVLGRDIGGLGGGRRGRVVGEVEKNGRRADCHVG